MHPVPWLLCAVTLAVSASPSVATTGNYDAKLERLIQERRHILEVATGIALPPGWEPMVSFGIPPDIHPARTYDFNARFFPGTRSFLFHPKFYAALNRWMDGEDPDRILVREPELCSAIDHELGHALTYAVAVQTENVRWFAGPGAPGISSADRVAFTLLAEGVGSYFQRRMDPERRDEGFLALPHGWTDPLWGDPHRVEYEGGYWIVFPILEGYGQRGLEYLLSHPMPLDDGRADDAGLAYRAQALRDLGAR